MRPTMDQLSADSLYIQAKVAAFSFLLLPAFALLYGLTQSGVWDEAVAAWRGDYVSPLIDVPSSLVKWLGLAKCSYPHAYLCCADLAGSLDRV
jgi:hypothetical protein